MIPADRWHLRNDDGPKVIPHKAARPRSPSNVRYRSGTGPLRHTLAMAVLDKLRTGAPIYVAALHVPGFGGREVWRRA